LVGLACSPQKKLIAVIEKSEPSAVVSFFDAVTLRRTKKYISIGEIGARDIRSLIVDYSCYSVLFYYRIAVSKLFFSSADEI
jgi:hypothetical protein